MIDRIFWPVVCLTLAAVCLTLFMFAKEQSKMLSSAYYLLSQQQTEIEVLRKRGKMGLQKKFNVRKFYDLKIDARDANGAPIPLVKVQIQPRRRTVNKGCRI